MVAPFAAPSPRRPGPPERLRRRYRPPVGVPLARARPWGVAVSVIAHVALLGLLIVVPALLRAVMDAPVARGAGGAGPAGGGGGARVGGAPAVEERVTFQRVAAPAPPPIETRTVPAVAQVVVPRPVDVPSVVPPAVSAVPVAPVAVARPESLAAVVGGTGTGSDSGGRGGAGPGTGGGVGTGTGTGRGSAAGPGTGGGEGAIYPATPDVMILPPLPVPSRLHGRSITLRFSIDSTGTITGISFLPSGDDAYDRQLRTRLMQYHFRPAHRPDGTPVASVFVMPMRL